MKLIKKDITIITTIKNGKYTITMNYKGKVFKSKLKKANAQKYIDNKWTLSDIKNDFNLDDIGKRLRDKAIKKTQENNFDKLFIDYKSSTIEALSKLKKDKQFRFEIKESVIYRFLKDDPNLKVPIDNYLAELYLSHTLINSTNKYDKFLALDNYLLKLYMNPDIHVIKQFSKFFKLNNCDITRNGNLVMIRAANPVKFDKTVDINYYNTTLLDFYNSKSNKKKVSDEVIDDVVNKITKWEFTHSRSFTNNPNIDDIRIMKFVHIDRSLCDNDPHAICSNGLHLAGSNFVNNSFGKNKFLAIVNPTDIVSVPEDVGYDKIRCCGYMPILFLENQNQKNELLSKFNSLFVDDLLDNKSFTIFNKDKEDKGVNLSKVEFKSIKELFKNINTNILNQEFINRNSANEYFEKLGLKYNSLKQKV